MELLNERGSTSQSGRRIPADATIATHTVAPMKGKLSECSGTFVFTITLVASASIKIGPTIPIRAQSKWYVCERVRESANTCVV